MCPATVAEKHWSRLLQQRGGGAPSYLRQLLSDPLIVLRTSGVEAYGAAGVHLAERHLLWRGAVIGLVREGGRHKALLRIHVQSAV